MYWSNVTVILQLLFQFRLQKRADYWIYWPGKFDIAEVLLSFCSSKNNNRLLCTFECSPKVKDLGKNKIFQKHMAYNLHILKIALNTPSIFVDSHALQITAIFSTFALRTLQLILWPKKGAKYKDLDFAFTSSEVKLEFSSFLQKWLAN